MTSNKYSSQITIAIIAASLSLAGCASETDADLEKFDQSNATLATVLSRDENLSTMSQALNDTSLNSVFDGAAAYTILAPTDEAFEAMGGIRSALASEEFRPVVIALLRDHIVPGQIDEDSIRQAIAANGGPVEMTTLGKGKLAFSVEGEDITVEGSGGSGTIQSDQAVIASNGVVLPIEGVLKRLPEAVSAQ